MLSLVVPSCVTASRLHELTAREAGGHGACEWRDDLTDWLEILKEQTEAGARMGREVPKMLSDPDISAEQVGSLFHALEEQAQFVEKLTKILEKYGYDFDIIKAAETLEERYVDLAAEAAEKLRAMRG